MATAKITFSINCECEVPDEIVDLALEPGQELASDA